MFLSLKWIGTYMQRLHLEFLNRTNPVLNRNELPGIAVLTICYLLLFGAPVFLFNSTLEKRGVKLLKMSLNLV